MTKIENICYSIYKNAVGYNTSGYSENKTSYLAYLDGVLNCLVETDIIYDFSVTRNFYQKITEICLWNDNGGENANIIIDVENHVAMSSLWGVDFELIADCRTGIRNLGKKVSI